MIMCGVTRMRNKNNKSLMIMTTMLTIVIVVTVTTSMARRWGILSFVIMIIINQV